MSSARQVAAVGGCVVLWLVLSLILVVWANSGNAWWAQFAPLVPMVLGVLILAPASAPRKARRMGKYWPKDKLPDHP